MKIPEGMTPQFEWTELFKLGVYTIWSKVDSDTNLQVIYQITEGQKPNSETGYYLLGPLLNTKNL
jgi:hypothetical protein